MYQPSDTQQAGLVSLHTLFFSELISVIHYKIYQENK